MRYLILLLCLLALPLTANAAKCTSNRSGVFHNSSTAMWTCSPSTGGVPGVGAFSNYSAVIANGHIAKVRSPLTVADNNGGGILINSGGNLTIESALTLRWNLAQLNGSTVIGSAGGSILLDNVTGGAAITWVNRASGGVGTLTINGASRSVPFVINGNGGRGGTNGYINLAIVGTTTMNVTINNAELRNLGASATNSLLWHVWTTHGPCSFTITNTTFYNCGPLAFNAITGIDSIKLESIDFRSPAASTIITFPTGVAKTTGERYVKKITVYNTVFNAATIAGNIADMLYEDCVLYNGVISTYQTAYNIIHRRNMFFSATIPDGQNILTAPYNSNAKQLNNIFVSISPNPHILAYSVAATTAQGDNEAAYNLFDGNGVRNGDYADCIYGNGTYSAHHNITINKGNVFMTIAMGTSHKPTIYNNTIASDWRAINVGESTSGQIQNLYNNLFVGSLGVHQDTNFVAQTTGIIDYNASYNNLDSAYLVYPVGHPYAGSRSYLDSRVNWWNPAQTFGVDNATHDIYADPNFVNPNWTVLGEIGASTVSDAVDIAIQLNGIDKDGNIVTPTVKSPTAIYNAAVAAFTPQNSLLKGTGMGGVDIGAVAPLVPSVPFGLHFGF